MVNNPFRFIFKEKRAWVNHDTVGIFDCPILPIKLRSSGVAKIASSNAFSDIRVHFVL